MHPPYSRAERAGQDVIDIVARALREWLRGNGLPVQEIHECVAARIEESNREAVQDALNEIRHDDE
jgi:hypothetical protein